MSAVTDNTFDKVLQASRPHVVMLWQPGCEPCKQLVPVLMQVARQMPGVQFTMMNSVANPKTKQRYGVAACPALLVFDDGKMLGRWLGMPEKRPEESVTDWLARVQEKITAWINRTLGAKYDYEENPHYDHAEGA